MQIGVGGGRRIVDHDVHGLVGIRMVDPPGEVVGSVVRELGPSAADCLERDPDITVTFVDSLPFAARPRQLDGGAAAYDDEYFYIADKPHNYVRIDFVTLGEQSTMMAPRTAGVIPLLVPVVALHLLRRGHVLLHSAAFQYRGSTTLVAAWKKGGKTEILLPFLANGAEYLSDEWTIVSADGTVHGLSADLHVWSWHAEQFPEVWARIPATARRRFRLLRRYQQIVSDTPPLLSGGGFLARQLRQLGRVGGAASVGQVRMAPEQMFDGKVWRDKAAIARILLAGVTPGHVQVHAVDSQLVAARMVASLAFERDGLITAYNQFRFAFPDQQNELIESARDRELDILSRAFCGLPAYEVVHPYPLDLRDLFEALQPICCG